MMVEGSKRQVCLADVRSLEDQPLKQAKVIRTSRPTLASWWAILPMPYPPNTGEVSARKNVPGMSTQEAGRAQYTGP